MPTALWHQGKTDEEAVKQLLQQHNRWTGSKRARDLLDDWENSRQKFVKVFPHEYKRALGEMAQAAEAEVAASATAKVKASATTK